MSSDFLDRMIQEMDTGLVPYGDGPDDAEYWSIPEERRARAFDAFAMRWVEGLPQYQAMSHLDLVFTAAWSGELGQLLANPLPEQVERKGFIKSMLKKGPDYIGRLIYGKKSMSSGSGTVANSFIS